MNDAILDQRLKLYTEVVWHPKKAKNTHNYEPLSTDIMVLGAFKSGTTWLQHILHQLRTKGQDTDFGDIYEISPFVPFHNMEMPEGYDFQADSIKRSRGGFRILKSHESPLFVKSCVGSKTIIIFRNPIDALYSAAKFIGPYCGGSSLEPLNSKYLLEFWSGPREIRQESHVEFIVDCMMSHRDRETLIIFYEDLVRSFDVVLKRIIDFTGLTVNESQLQLVKLHCSHKWMTDNKHHFMGDLKVLVIPQNNSPLRFKDVRRKAMDRPCNPNFKQQELHGISCKLSTEMK